MSWTFQILSADGKRWVGSEVRYASAEECQDAVRAFMARHPYILMVQTIETLDPVTAVFDPAVGVSAWLN